MPPAPASGGGDSTGRSDAAHRRGQPRAGGGAKSALKQQASRQASHSRPLKLAGPGAPLDETARRLIDERVAPGRLAGPSAEGPLGAPEAPGWRAPWAAWKFLGRPRGAPMAGVRSRGEATGRRGE